MSDRTGRNEPDPAAPKDVGGEETKPGQTEIVAGTVEHHKELTQYPNASSYAGDVNVVLPPEGEEAAGGEGGAPTVIDTPHASQDGNTLNCTMGNWTGEPTSYAYKWLIDGEDVVGGNQSSLSVDATDVGKTATCVVTATNAEGSTEAEPSNGVVIEYELQRDAPGPG